MDTKVGKKPGAGVIGEDENVFMTLGISAQALRKAGLHEEAKEMSSKVMSAGSYSEALSIMQEYVDFE